MGAVRKHERQRHAAIRGEAGNVTALFGPLAKAPEPPQPYDKVLKERDALHRLFEQAPGFMALLEGPDHRYTFSNAANNRLLGRSDVVGKTVAEAFPELVEQGFVERLNRVYATGEPYIGNGLPFEIRDTCDAEPHLRIVNFVYQPIRSAPDAPITGIFIEGHDVTEQHEAHALIQAENLSLVHVSRISAMGTMASTVAHELNQPLAAIVNYLSAASRIAGRGGADPLLEGCLVSAQEASLRAGNILRLLRDMTLSGVDLSPVFDVEGALEQAVELARASHPNLEVTYDIQPGVTAKVDRIQFQQVMLNLIRNAQEACGEHPCQLVITVSCDDTFLQVMVADNGIGFADDDFMNVFETLTTSKPQGMGVGLSVCRTIIETYGGRIWAQNGPDGGATVRFTIPRG